MTGQHFVLVVVGALVIWTAAAWVTAEYGRGKGFPFFPLFLSAWFLGFPLVLLAITIGAGPRLGQDWVTEHESATLADESDHLY